MAATGWALTARGREGLFARGLAIALAFMGGSGIAFGLPGQVFAYAIGLMLAYIYMGRNARITLFWVGAGLMSIPLASVIHVALTALGIVVEVWQRTVILWPVGIILAPFLAKLLRYLVRTHLMSRIGRTTGAEPIRTLEIGYLLSMGLAVYGAVTNYINMMNPDTF